LNSTKWILPVFVLGLLSNALFAAGSSNLLLNPNFSRGADNWKPVRPNLLELKSTPEGAVFKILTPPAMFNDLGFIQNDISLAKGEYTFRFEANGEAGARIFFGFRKLDKSGATFGDDIWVTLNGGASQKIEKTFRATEDLSVRLLFCLGMKENEGKTISVNGLSFAYARPLGEAPGTSSKPIGPGAEYDGIVLIKESELGDTNTKTAKVRIQEKNVIRKTSPLLFGYNHDGPSDQKVIMKDNRLKEDLIKDLQGLPMTLNRIQVFGYFPNVKWKQCIGPFEERGLVKFNQWDPWEKKAYGPIEAVDFCQRVDPKAQFSWVVNLVSETPEDNADLAEFLTGTGESKRGLTNWGKLRKDLGLAKPVPVVIWEMGNEVEWASASNRMPLQTYIDLCKKNIAAIRSVSPQAKIAMHAATAPWGYEKRFNEDWKVWHRKILEQCGNEIDYISMHPYYSGLPIAYMETFMDTVRNDILSITGTNRIKIYVSEHSTWPPDINKQESWFNVQTLSSCLSVSHFFVRLLQREDIGAATYHCFTSGNRLWGIVQVGKETQKLYRSGFSDVFTIFSKYLGEDVVESTVRGEAIDVSDTSLGGEKTLFVTAATTTKDGLNLFLVNRDVSAKRKIDFIFGESYLLKRETVFTAPSPRSHNTEFITNQFVTEREFPGAPFDQYLMPEKSLVVLQLKKK